MDNYNQNPKLSNVPNSINLISRHGQPYVFPYDTYKAILEHIQGIASDNDLIFISQNVTSSIDVYNISNGKFIRSIKLNTVLPHYGGIQKIGSFLAVPVETKEHDPNPRSEIRFIDLTTNKEATTLTIDRPDRKAGGVGIANYTFNGVEHTMLVVHDNGVLEFYVADSLISPSVYFNLIKPKYQLKRGYDSIALVVDLQQQIFLVGFWSECDYIPGIGDAPRIDYVDLLQIITTTEGFKCTLIKEGIHFITHGHPLGYAGPHFRYGSGIEIHSDNFIRILATSRGMDDFFNVNLFEYWLREFSSQDCGKTKGTAVSPKGLPRGSQVSINNSIDLSKCIVGNNNAKVFSITLEKNNSNIYEYIIKVVAQGPIGGLTSSLDLFFTDESGGKPYSLSIIDSDIKEHILEYNSEKPAIQKIEWISN